MLPPLLTDFAHEALRRLGRGRPRWHRITSGVLQGREIFVNSRSLTYRAMIDGTHDNFFWGYLSDSRLAGATVCDVGGHSGYHTLAFSTLVGDSGQVIMFEPNEANLERLNMNVSRNSELAKRIHVVPKAVSDVDGEIEFSFSSNIEDQTSSGGYVEGSHTLLPGAVYEAFDFKTRTIEAHRFDTFYGDREADDLKLIKIDVEGAENMVLAGAAETLARSKPLLLIEVHSVTAMLKVCELLMPLGYSIEVIEENRASRCCIAARRPD